MIIVNQTYIEERLGYFTSLMHKARRKYHCYLKRFGKSPYGSDENIMLSDAARDVHFCADVVEMLEKQSNGCDACKPDHETCGTCARFSDYELDGSGDDRCSANCLHGKCGFHRPVNYCPNCGRKMKGGGVDA